MKKENIMKKAIIAAAAMASVATATPAYADLFSYTQTNGDVLTIDTRNNSGTIIGQNISASFDGDFSNFAGSANPTGKFLIDNLQGTRNVRGVSVQPNPQRQQSIIFGAGGRTNLWSSWGDPVIGGDYITYIENLVQSPSTSVPAPGMLGLFGLGLVGLGFARGRRKYKVKMAAA